MALRYACGVLLCLVGWLGLVVLPGPARPWVFLLMAIVEMCVPLFAEKNYETAWHPHHIAERYGLFTIIVLGETVAAATVAVKSAVDEHDALGELLPIAAGGLLIVFSAWWIYFVVGNQAKEYTLPSPPSRGHGWEVGLSAGMKTAPSLAW